MGKKSTPPAPAAPGKGAAPSAFSVADILKVLLKVLKEEDIAALLKLLGIFDLTTTQISDPAQALASGVAVKAGTIKVTGVKLLPNPDSTPNTNPVSAVIISDDESVYLTGTPNTAGTAPVIWDFTWANVPPIGEAYVRLIEVSPDPTNPGTTQTFAINIYEDLDNDPVLVGVDSRRR